MNQLKSNKGSSKKRPKGVKSFVESSDGNNSQSYAKIGKGQLNDGPSKISSKHMRHKSDTIGWSSNQLSKSKRSSKSKNRDDSKKNHDHSQFISSIQVFDAKSLKYFGGKKYSCLSDSTGGFSKRMPSITYLKKSVNSPMMSSTEDLIRNHSKSKSKHQRKLSKLVKNAKFTKSKKKYLRVGNYTRQVSARRISTISED